MNTADHLVKILNEARTAAGLSSLDMQLVYIPAGKKHDTARAVKSFNVQQEQIKTARETLKSRLNKAELGHDLKLCYYVAVISSLPNNTFWRALTDASEVMSGKHWASSILMQNQCEQEESDDNLNRFSKRAFS